MNISTLPGGLLFDGVLHRDFVFAPITGIVERQIVESAVGIDSLAHQVTKILVSALSSLAGQPTNKKLVQMLSSGDREFLILSLHSLIEPDAQWITRNCSECKELVQFQLHSTTLPIKAAGEDYPQTAVALSFCDALIRVPTGADEEALSDNCKGHDAALDLLLKRLLTSIDENTGINTVLGESLTIHDQLLIDGVLDKMSPQISHSVNITCPYCLAEQDLPIDHYEWIVNENNRLDDQIHTLAFYYHWSEKEILSLSKTRRSHYVALIERSLFKAQSNLDVSILGGRV